MLSCLPSNTLRVFLPRQIPCFGRFVGRFFVFSFCLSILVLKLLRPTSSEPFYSSMFSLRMLGALKPVRRKKVWRKNIQRNLRQRLIFLFSTQVSHWTPQSQFKFCSTKSENSKLINSFFHSFSWKIWQVIKPQSHGKYIIKSVYTQTPLG